MKNKKWTGLIISGFALSVVTGLCVMTIVGTVQWIKEQGPAFSFFSYDTVKAEGSETIILDPEGLEQIDLDLESGDITVLRADGQEIRVEVDKSAWGSSLEQAEARLEEMVLEQSINGNTLNLSFDYRPEQYAFSFGNNIPPRMNVVLYLPDGFDTLLQNWNGDVVVQNYQGSMTVQHSFGEISIEDLTGKLTINNSSGSLTLENIDARGEIVDIASNFGEIKINDFQAAEIIIESSSSNLMINGLQVSGRCDFTNRFALTEIFDFTCGSFSLYSNGPYTELENGQVADELSIQTDFVSLSMTQVAASAYDIESNSGSLTVDFMQGEVTIKNNFGDIEIQNAQTVILDIETQSGNVTFSGSLDPDHAQTITTSMGEVSLSLPIESAFNVALETRFGVIQTDFQIALNGEINAQNIEGTINGGGPRLTINSESANIYLGILEPGDE